MLGKFIFEFFEHIMYVPYTGAYVFGSCPGFKSEFYIIIIGCYRDMPKGGDAFLGNGGVLHPHRRGEEAR